MSQRATPTDTQDISRPRSVLDSIGDSLFTRRSIWMWALLGLGMLMVILINTNNLYYEAYDFIAEGIELTIVVALSAFLMAQLIGLTVALMRISKNLILYNISTFYVEVVRGIPIIVQLIYMAFVIFPGIVYAFNALGSQLLPPVVRSGIAPTGSFYFHTVAPAWYQTGSFASLGHTLLDLTIRDFPMEMRAIIGLGIAYGAYEAEVYRAGIESISRGQMEAARSLGMSYVQAMRHVILPQAVRRVLPPIGNDFIAILKDSSLVTVLAVDDLTHKGELHRARTFRTFETWNVVTFLYLILTISFSRVVRWLERRLSTDE